MGMTSAFPALLEIPLTVMLEQLPLPHAVKQALRGEPGIYRDVLDLLTAYEHGNWQSCGELAQRIRISETATSAFYINSLEWARLVTSDTGETATHRTLAESFVSYQRSQSATPASDPLTALNKP